MGNVYNRVRNGWDFKGETATEIDSKNNIEMQEDLEQEQLLIQCETHNRPVEALCLNISCPHDKCICSQCQQKHPKCSTYIMPIKKFQPLYFQRRDRLQKTKQKALHDIEQQIQEMRSVCPEFEQQIDTQQRILLQSLSYCDNYASAAHKIIKNHMNDTTKKEIARFVLTGSDDIAKMQFKNINSLLKNRKNINIREHLMTLTGNKMEPQQPYIIKQTKFSHVVEILQNLKETPRSLKIICTDTNNLDFDSLAEAFKLNFMRNLRHLVIYSRWYLEDIEIYKKLISAWENNNILRRVDIYTTTPIINAKHFNKFSKKVNFYCQQWHQ